MGLFSIFLLMILCHIIDDFVLQPICLSKLKQKSWWKENAPDSLYKDDYKVALFIHSLSWSIMIILPFIFFENVPWIVMAFFVALNCFMHYRIDDLKANENKINLRQDQTAHFLQIVMTFLAFIPFMA